MESGKRQLVFLWPYVEWGGAQVYCLAIMKLARNDWDIRVILPKGSPKDLVEMVREAGGAVEFLQNALDLSPAHGLVRKLRRQRARIATEIESFRRLSNFDLKRAVLHVDLAPWQSWIFYSLLSLKGANVFVTLHNSLRDLPAWRELLFRTRMQIVSRLRGFHILPSNHDTRNKLKPWVATRAWESMPVTYTCVDKTAIDLIEEERVDRDALRRKHGIPTDKFVVLTVGQFIDRKGRWVLLEAARNVVQIDKDVIFVWVTPTLPDGSESERVSSYGLSDAFRLIRSATIGGRADVLRFFKTGDCFVLPSYVEGLPIAVLEAMALGVPTISTNVFAIPEAVKPEETGLLIEAGDSDALCTAILRLKNDRDLSERLSKQGREFVLENFDEREASRIAIEAYERCFQ